jgi:hypothetical protein
VMLWLLAEMKTAARSSGPAPATAQGESAATIPGSRSQPEPRAK